MGISMFNLDEYLLYGQPAFFVKDEECYRYFPKKG